MSHNEPSRMRESPCLSPGILCLVNGEIWSLLPWMGVQNIDLGPKQWLFRMLWPELCSVSGSLMLGMQREGLTDQLLGENRSSVPDYLDDEHGTLS